MYIVLHALVTKHSCHRQYSKGPSAVWAAAYAVLLRITCGGCMNLAELQYIEADQARNHQLAHGGGGMGWQPVIPLMTLWSWHVHCI